MPGGAEAKEPTTKVPPTLTCVLFGGVAKFINGEVGSDAPMVKVMVPPLVPFKIAGGPFKSEMIFPGGLSTSKIA